MRPAFPDSGRQGNRRVSAAVGILPIKSRLTHLRNSPSSATAAGRTLAAAHYRSKHCVDPSRESLSVPQGSKRAGLPFVTIVRTKGTEGADQEGDDDARRYDTHGYVPPGSTKQ